MNQERIEALVGHLKESGFLHDERIARAFRIVPLEEFIPQELLYPEILYQDRPQIFYAKSLVNRRTISAPHMISIMVEYLNLNERDNLLILGSKSGYIAAIASLLCSEGQVYVVESSEEVLELTRNNLRSTGFDANVTLIHGNPLTMAGTESLGTWDKILVPYQVQEHEIYPALGQLNDGGVLFAPVGDYTFQFFTQVIKHEGRYFGNKISTVVFSPLEKNVTFLSQQVEFLGFLKKIKADEVLGSSIDEEIDEAREALERRKRGIDRRQLTVLYDTEEAERLHQQYIMESHIEVRDEEDIEVLMIESIAVDMAVENNGKVRLMTIVNKTNIPFEVLKLYLKKSKLGHLTGDLSNVRKVSFVLKQGSGDSDPLVIGFMDELQANLELIRGHVEKQNIEETLDIVTYTMEKIAFVEGSSNFSLKKFSVLLSGLLHLLDMFDKVLSSRGKGGKEIGEMAGRVKEKIMVKLHELSRAVKDF
ncbi:MAG: hypothetical protein ACTSUE_26815 [Promethearchaeota archaeon]